MAPTRDVTVTFHVVRAPTAGGPRKTVVRQTEAGLKLRVDSYIFDDAKTAYEGMIVDRMANRATILVFANELAVEAPAAGVTLPGITMTPDMGFRRRGARTVAGLSCTDWDVVPAGSAEPWTACVTADGVVLRAASATREIEATAVAYGAVPGSMFEVPAGLKRMAAERK